jgi:hypothetical protein
MTASPEPMTPEQTKTLRMLARRAGDPDVFDEALSSEEADKRIAALRTLLDRESHSGQERLPRT